MPRRRPTLITYLRRRWRVAGGLVVLLLGGLLVLAIADRGHDPLWDVREDDADRLSLAPDGEHLYLLARAGEAGNVVRLESRSTADGALLWKIDLNESRALLAAAEDGVVVATDIPRPILTYYAEDGHTRWQLPFQGTPRALRVEGGVVAMALTATGNPVVVAKDGAVLHAHRFPDLVRTLDLRAGNVAIGTSGGNAAVFAPDGALRVNLTFNISVDAVRLSRSGDQMLLGGISRATGELAGAVAFVDLRETEPLRWMHATSAGVGLVDLDAAGKRALAVEQSSQPGYALRVFEGESGVQTWAVTADGPVARDDAAAFGGAALSPDGQRVVYATPRGDIRVYSLPRGELDWSFRAEGSSVILFGDASDRFVATARLVASGPIGAVLLFAVGVEPLWSNLPFVAGALVVAVVGMGSIILGVGFWRLRRSY